MLKEHPHLLRMEFIGKSHQGRETCPRSVAALGILPFHDKDQVTTGTIFDLRRYSIHDGPGIRTAVFFKGCPLTCAWCHNPESLQSSPELMFRLNRCNLCGDCLEACPHDAIHLSNGVFHIDRSRCTVSGRCARVCPTEALEVVGREMTVEQVMAAIEPDRVFYEESGGGVTFTGGEPLAQPGFLLALLRGCRQAGISTVAGYLRLRRLAGAAGNPAAGRPVSIRPEIDGR